MQKAFFSEDIFCSCNQKAKETGELKGKERGEEWLKPSILSLLKPCVKTIHIFLQWPLKIVPYKPVPLRNFQDLIIFFFIYRFWLKIPCIIVLYHREVRYSFMKDVFISDWHLLNRRGPRHTTLFQANLSALKQYSIHNLLSAPQGSHTAKPLQLNSLHHREVHYLAKV